MLDPKPNVRPLELKPVRESYDPRRECEMDWMGVFALGLVVGALCVLVGLALAFGHPE
jgi:hypothetical protein